MNSPSRPRRCFAVVALAGLATASVTHAQTSRDDPSDMQAWFAVGLNLNLPNSWEASLKYRGRMVNDASDYRGSYVTTELGYRASDHVLLLSSYRLAAVDGAAYHRLGVGAEFIARPGKTKLSLRPLWQAQRRNFSGDDEQSDDTKSLLRVRGEAQRALSPAVDLYVSAEPYVRLGADYVVDNWRNTAGVKYEFAKGRKIDFFYIYRPDYAKSYNRTYHVVGLDLMFDWKL